MKNKKNQENYYIDNGKFLAVLIDYRNKLKLDPLTRIPEYIGKCILLICGRLATRGNFSGYTYRDELVDDAIEDCVMAVKNFDPEKSKNPYGYFTRIAWFAFLQRIYHEKKQNYIKHKNFQNSHLLDDIDMKLTSDLSEKVIGEFEDNITKNLAKLIKKDDNIMKTKLSRVGLNNV